MIYPSCFCQHNCGEHEVLTILKLFFKEDYYLDRHCGLQSAVCGLRSAVCSLQSANVIHRIHVESESSIDEDNIFAISPPIVKGTSWNLRDITSHRQGVFDKKRENWTIALLGKNWRTPTRKIYEKSRPYNQTLLKPYEKARPNLKRIMMGKT